MIRFTLPFRGNRIVQEYGFTPFSLAHPEYYKNLFHSGIDYAVPIGTPIHASHNGYIVRDQDADAGGYGIYVMIWDDKQSIMTLYGHLTRNSVTLHEYVTKGHEIGLSGKSGNVTGPHLHYELILTNKKGDRFPGWAYGATQNPLISAQEL